MHRSRRAGPIGLAVLNLAVLMPACGDMVLPVLRKAAEREDLRCRLGATRKRGFSSETLSVMSKAFDATIWTPLDPNATKRNGKRLPGSLSGRRRMTAALMWRPYIVGRSRNSPMDCRRAHQRVLAWRRARIWRRRHRRSIGLGRAAGQIINGSTELSSSKGPAYGELRRANERLELER